MMGSCWDGPPSCLLDVPLRVGGGGGGGGGRRGGGYNIDRSLVGESIACSRRIISESGANPDLVFRPDFCDNNEEHSDMGHTQIEFLQEGDKVLTTDPLGNIFLFQLPFDRKGKHKLLAHIIGENHHSPTSIKLHPLRDGQTFCVGQPSGLFQIYSLQHKIPASFDKTHKFTSVGPLHGYQCTPVRRRYHRSFPHNFFSLQQQIQQQLQQQQPTPLNSFNQNQQNLIEIDNWHSPQVTRLNSLEWHQNIHRYPWRKQYSSFDSAGWAFSEPSAGSVLAASIDSQKDCFSLIDSRHPRHPVLCSVQTNTSTNTEEDLTAISFLNHNTLITSHVQTTTTTNKSSSSSNKIMPTNLIKQWDIRINRKRPLTACFLPSFPDDTIKVCEPQTTWKVPHDNTNTTKTKASTTATTATPHSAFRPITNLTSSSSSSFTHTKQTVLITMRSQRGDCVETLWFDPIREKVVCRHKETVPDPSYKGTPLLCSTPSLDFMVSTITNRAGETCLKMYQTDRLKGKTALLGKRNIKLEDSYGIGTRLSCLAFDTTGTTLLGGGSDGDIFIWDGRSPNTQTNTE